MKGLRKPLATLVALAGLAAFAWGLHHLLLIGSCGGDGYAPCPPGSGKYFAGVAVGITVAIIGTIAGGGALTFIAIFLTIGLTSILTGVSDAGAESRGFLYVFGGSFTAVALAPLLFAPFVLARRRRAAALLEHGTQAVGTVTAVHDTKRHRQQQPTRAPGIPDRATGRDAGLRGLEVGHGLAGGDPAPRGPLSGLVRSRGPRPLRVRHRRHERGVAGRAAAVRGRREGRGGRRSRRPPRPPRRRPRTIRSPGWASSTSCGSRERSPTPSSRCRRTCCWRG